MSAFAELKAAIVALTGLSMDALHIYVGLGVYILASWLLRRSPGSARPWMAVLIVALGLELLDIRESPYFWVWQASLHDIINTLFWPTVLFLIVRSGIAPFARKRAKPE